jgi:acetyl esterase/lipase
MNFHNNSELKLWKFKILKNVFKKSDPSSIPARLLFNHPKFSSKPKIKSILIHVHGGGWVAMQTFSHQGYTR